MAKTAKRRDMSQAQFDRACEKYGITRSGEGERAHYTWGATTMPVRTGFGDQLPWQNRRKLLAALIARVEEDRRLQEERAAVRAKVRGDRVCVSYIGERMHGLVLSQVVMKEGDTARRVKVIYKNGYTATVDLERCSCPLLRDDQRWNGPANLVEALEAKRETMVKRLAELDEEIAEARRARR